MLHTPVNGQPCSPTETWSATVQSDRAMGQHCQQTFSRPATVALSINFFTPTFSDLLSSISFARGRREGRLLPYHNTVALSGGGGRERGSQERA